MSNNKNIRASTIRITIACLALGWMALPAQAQEIPDFGSGAAGGLVIDTPVRVRPGAQPAPPPPPEEGQPPGAIEEVITTGMARREFQRNWSAVPGVVHSESSDVIGFDLKGKKERGNNKSDQFLIGYSHIDPDGADRPFNQGKLRYRNTFAAFPSGWAFEAQAQLTKRWEKYFEQSAQFNIGFRPYDSLTLTLAVGYMRRDRDSASTLKDRDLRFIVNQALPSIPGLSVSAEYRLENDITGEDDFTVGAVFRGWSLSIGKHRVTALSYTLNLKPPAG